eukprot:403337063
MKSIFKEVSNELNEIPSHVKNEIIKEGLRVLPDFVSNQVILDPTLNKNRVHIYIIVQGQVIIAPTDQEMLILSHYKNKFCLQVSSYDKEIAQLLNTQSGKTYSPKNHSQIKPCDLELLEKLKLAKSYPEVIQLLIQEQKIQVFNEGDCFGNYYSITGNNWERSYCLVESDSLKLLEIDTLKLAEMIEKQNENQNHRQLLQFLTKHILGFDKIDINGSVNKMKKQMMIKKGYMSNTVNQFMIGSLSTGSWIAQDIIIPVNSQVLQQPGNPPDNPQLFNYSVIAQTQMIILEMPLIEMKQKLPKDFLQNIEQTYQERKNWKTVRLMDIQNTNQRIYQQNQNLEAYQEAIENVSKLHEKASTAVMSKFRDKFLVLKNDCSKINGQIDIATSSQNNAQFIFDNCNLRKRTDIYDKAAIKPVIMNDEDSRHHVIQRNKVKKTLDFDSSQKQVQFDRATIEKRSQTPNQVSVQQYQEQNSVFNKPNLANMMMSQVQPTNSKKTNNYGCLKHNPPTIKAAIQLEQLRQRNQNLNNKLIMGAIYCSRSIQSEYDLVQQLAVVVIDLVIVTRSSQKEIFTGFQPLSKTFLFYVNASQSKLCQQLDYSLCKRSKSQQNEYWLLQTPKHLLAILLAK